MAVALIVAAGRGERLGQGQPKALVPLSGRPMLQWSVDALRAVPAVQEIVVALPSDRLDCAPEGTRAVAGGQTRSQSVRAALGVVGDGDPVIVHDAARPLASPALFERALGALEGSGADAVVAAAPVPDTIKEVTGDGRTVSRTLERARLWAVQTPQVFRRASLEAAFARAGDDILAAATDDAWLIEQEGGSVQVLPWAEPNVKVTTPAELRLAEILLESR
ncbi:MAG: 2-C-methyl-D-erythritol 4-phosphate cytidylyltransferase [Solirubrobacteraceae bacterium]